MWDFVGLFLHPCILYPVATGLLALVLGRLAWIDLNTFRLPDALTMPLILAGLGLAALPGGTDLSASLVGGVVGFVLFWGVGQFYFTRRNVEGLGLGDAKLFAASGTWLGVLNLPYVLLIASLGGLAFAILRRGAGAGQIAFGPWLCLGFLAVWIKAAVLVTC